MTQQTDRELIQHLVNELQGYRVAHPDHEMPALEAGRIRLAQPEPEGPEVIGSEWQPCVKLPITVHVREQQPGETHISTREGITPVRPDDLIMRGVQGEEYPIGRELFNRTYRMGEAVLDQSGPERLMNEECFIVPVSGPPRWGRPAIKPVPVSERWLDAVMGELAKAEAKHPEWPTDPLHAIAVIGEEFGELTQAVLQVTYEPGKSLITDVRREAVQTAAMALRFLESMDDYIYADDTNTHRHRGNTP